MVFAVVVLLLAPALLGRDIGLAGRLAMVVVSFGLAILTLHLIENPVRLAPSLRPGSLATSAMTQFSHNAPMSGRHSSVEKALSKARDAALASVSSIATEAAQDIVAKVSGASVSTANATKAVKAVLANG